MADSCSSEEERAILLGAFMQHIDEEEKRKAEETKRMLGSLKDCAAPAVRRISCSGEGN